MTRPAKKKQQPSLLLRQFQFPDKYGEWLGYEIKEFDRPRQRVRTELKIRKDHLSPAGRVHGGVISGFFDFTCGAAVFTTLQKDDFCSTVELKVNYLKPIDINDRLEADASVVFRGKKLCVILGFIYKNGENKPTAMATATFNVVEGKK